MVSQHAAPASSAIQIVSARPLWLTHATRVLAAPTQAGKSKRPTMNFSHLGMDAGWNTKAGG
jgi:hypothetical protein